MYNFYIKYSHNLQIYTTQEDQLLIMLFKSNDSIFEETRNYVRKDREQSEELVTKEGLRQGRTLNRILFIIIMDDVAKEVKSKIKQIHVG